MSFMNAVVCVRRRDHNGDAVSGREHTHFNRFIKNVGAVVSLRQDMRVNINHLAAILTQLPQFSPTQRAHSGGADQRDKRESSAEIPSPRLNRARPRPIFSGMAPLFAWSQPPPHRVSVMRCPWLDGYSGYIPEFMEAQYAHSGYRGSEDNLSRYLGEVKRGGEILIRNPNQRDPRDLTVAQCV